MADDESNNNSVPLEERVLQKEQIVGTGYRISTKERAEDIKQAIADGASSTEKATVAMHCEQRGIKNIEPIPAREPPKVELIRQGAARGDPVEKIAYDAELALRTVYKYASIHGIKLSGLLRKKRVRAIEQAIADGANSVENVAKQVGLAESTIRDYGSRYGIRIPGTRIRPYLNSDALNKQAGSLLQALSEGENSLERLCAITGKGPYALRNFCKKNEISLPEDLIPYSPRSDIVELIPLGLTLEEMGEKVGFTRERVRQILCDGGYTTIHQESKRKLREDRKRKIGQEALSKQIFLSLLQARQKELAQQSGYAQQKAVQYQINCPGSIYQYADLVTFFTKVENARKNGVKSSLEELCEGLPWCFPVGGRILKKVGDEPLFGTREVSSHLSPDEAEAVKQTFNLEMSASDVGYFLGRPDHVVNQRWAKLGSKKRSTYIKRLKGHFLTYRLASQIYEAQDLGFVQKEIMDLFETNQELVGYAFEHRDTIGKNIITALKMISPQEEISVPYRQADNTLKGR